MFCAAVLLRTQGSDEDYYTFAFLTGEDGEMHHDEQNPDVKELLKLVNGLSSEEFQLVLGSVENMVRFANLKKRVV